MSFQFTTFSSPAQEGSGCGHIHCRLLSQIPPGGSLSPGTAVPHRSEGTPHIEHRCHCVM